MTGPEHYREAERLLGEAYYSRVGEGLIHPERADEVATAQVHATLALAAATALQTAGVYIPTNATAEWTVAILGWGEGSDD